MNKCIFTGRFTKSLELRRTQGGTAVVTADIAVDVGFGEKKKTAYPTLVIWGKSAEFIAKHADKGSMVEAIGSYTERKWEDKEGRKRVSVEIQCDEIKMLSAWVDGDKESQDENDGYYYSTTQGGQQFSEIGNEDENDEQLPF